MAQSERTEKQDMVAADDMHWGINYLREDIQDLRQEGRQDVKDLREEVRQGFRELRAEARDRRVEAKAELAEMQKAQAAQYAEMRRAMDLRFYWSAGISIGLSGMLAGLMTALIKL